jgi:hypothetical protein
MMTKTMTTPASVSSPENGSRAFARLSEVGRTEHYANQAEIVVTGSTMAV